MKVITIKQPWASLIVSGYKQYEFRTWNTKYRGDILIHAGKGIDKLAIAKFKEYNLEYPRGCIIGKARITDSIYVDDKLMNYLSNINPLVYDNIINNNTWHGYAFKIDNIEKISPIYINGKLSLWNYDYEGNERCK